MDITNIHDIDKRKNALTLLETAVAVEDAIVLAEDNENTTEAELDALALSAEEAWDAYHECGVALLTGPDWEPYICSRTGVPLLVTDKYDYVLREAAGVEEEAMA